MMTIALALMTVASIVNGSTSWDEGQPIYLAILPAAMLVFIASLLMRQQRLTALARAQKRQGKPTWSLTEHGLFDVYISDHFLTWELLGPAVVAYVKRTSSTRSASGHTSSRTTIEPQLHVCIRDWDAFQRIERRSDSAGEKLAQKASDWSTHGALSSNGGDIRNRFIKELRRLARHNGFGADFNAQESRIADLLQAAPSLWSYQLLPPAGVSHEQLRDILNAEFLRRDGALPAFALTREQPLGREEEPKVQPWE
ncbi:hypothetical protein MAIT1_03911 [Magnetofaba australis IT-1]|uniref:Uncharacterized protein n=1 Tax=Magnetofaba australis IT-1 TaxID=1434232 RepID=A0A1Y2K8V2_9PROT|nr:hypothetical protein MAIT1_03911 [Magnetofaba australis IT-1]